MIHTAKLNSDLIDEIELTCDAKARLLEAGYPVDEVNAWSVVNHKPEGENSGYLVVEIETLSVPIQLADAVEDKAFAYMCTCPSYLYQSLSDIEDAGVSPVSVSPCKHCQAVDKTLRSQHDNQQETL